MNKEEFSGKKVDMTDSIDTGYIWECPICGGKYHLIHRQKEENGRLKLLKHDFEECVDGPSTVQKLAKVRQVLKVQNKKEVKK